MNGWGRWGRRAARSPSREDRRAGASPGPGSGRDGQSWATWPPGETESRWGRAHRGPGGCHVPEAQDARRAECCEAGRARSPLRLEGGPWGLKIAGVRLRSTDSTLPISALSRGLCPSLVCFSSAPPPCCGHAPRAPAWLMGVSGVPPAPEETAQPPGERTSKDTRSQGQGCSGLPQLGPLQELPRHYSWSGQHRGPGGGGHVLHKAEPASQGAQTPTPAESW